MPTPDTSTTSEADWAARFRLPAWRHQDDEFRLHRDDAGRMWRWQMRTGKTKAAIDLCCYRYERGEINAVFIAAPNNVHANWPRKELPKHVWAGIRWKAITWSTTKSKNVAWCQEFYEALQFEGLLFICVNAEALGDLTFKEEFLKAFLKARRRKFGFIGDETHDLSRRVSSKKSKAARGIAHQAVFRRGLSGTITDNSPLHAYGQYELIERGALGFDAYGKFEARYAQMKDVYVPGGHKRKTLDFYKNQDELQAKIAVWTSVVLREDCNDLPDLMEDENAFDLHPRQRDLYNAVCRDGLARLDGGEIIPPKEGGALIIQLQQIGSGFVIDEDGGVHDVVSPEENPRLIALRAELALAGPKSIIWCRFREDIVRVHRACQKWGYAPVHYYGGTSAKDRARNEDQFQTDPKCGPLVAQPKACGQGLEFSAAGSIFRYSHLHGDRIARLQADERATQMGGRRIFITDLVAEGTNDRRMIKDMADKGTVSDHLTGEGLRAFLATVS